MRTIAVMNKKGGAGKTHTCMGLAAAARSRGYRVGVIDTDPNQSAVQWLETFPDIDGAACEPDKLDAILDAIDGDFDIAIIDTPPNDVAVIETVAALVNLVLVPCAPTGIEVRQLGGTFSLLGSTPWMVVPNRIEMSTTSGRIIRDLFDAEEITHSTAVVPKRAAIADSFGAAPPLLPYVALVDEVLSKLDLAVSV